MNEDQQTELLCRIDERTETICKWIGEHKQQHRDEKANIKKYLFVIYSALIGVVVKVMFWN